MKYKLAEDAHPQVKLLLIAAVITIALWFIPFADYLVYPIRLFVTFIHEGSHVVAGLLTGSSVQSMTISPDGSGVVNSLSTSWLSVLITSSAGYLGAVAFGSLLLMLIRKTYSARIVLVGTAVFIGLMTLIFGLLAPLWNIFPADVTVSSIAFTVITGAFLTAALVAIAKFASDWWANFTLAFLAVQCLLNAVADLKTLLYINSPLFESHMHSDAANMQQVTGIPSILWVFIWIGVSVLFIGIGLRVYAVANQSKNHDLPFED